MHACTALGACFNTWTYLVCTQLELCPHCAGAAFKNSVLVMIVMSYTQGSVRVELQWRLECDGQESKV